MFEARSYAMVNLLKWVGATAAAFVLVAGTASAGEGIFPGKVKSINADKKEVVVTDEGKDKTFKLADNVVINRNGKESQTDLKVDDPVNILYDKGLTGLTWTAKYILIKEGDHQYSELERGVFKAYDPDKKEITVTDEFGHDVSFPAGDAKLLLNGADNKVESFKIGDVTLAIVKKYDNKTTLQSLMVERK